MAVMTECKPLTHALPGGREGASVRLTPLLTGELLAPPEWVRRRRGGLLGLLGATLGGRGDWIWLPVPAFLVEHPSAGPLLVDTGLHPALVDGPAPNMGRNAKLLYRPRVTREQAVTEQLERRGIAPADVRTVVMTHLHVDHASGVEQLPAATFVVDAREWSAACEGGWREGYHSRQFDHAFDWRTIDYEAASVDSFASFGASFDLFGDGSVRLLSTPGHTRGHQSVLLRLREREALLAGDALYTRGTLDGDLPLAWEDEHRFRRSLREIERFLEQTPGALVIPGHDGPAWQALDPVYE
ncbi:N-acyl homoserine lactonase family protein [Conexibacter sp. JD483]|uniref:N-acyl homoserine lactonase family protein n=1 Tax=unclassified Conexibacter TaxID=2627773 RepID=UPI002723F3CA|nr:MULTISPECIES: N-acyl homoserine lactonase family protein [unclassified Conexibacter]MDO8186113.1 N-acyl homoserine lactonase family protein [Conexibacter sp. CPCC 205706]MDO8199603.1 N-acyl homoserine lactonase family protein [Conexibacter sp. CPCC 205762]MDR9369143.1 N-acyl homoserine lactonase family protein [Conexibacter sp. JD483]